MNGLLQAVRFFYLNEEYEWIVDIDLEKCFDNVPQDKLMSHVHDIINDGDTESLIRKFLKAGAMTSQGYEATNIPILRTSAYWERAVFFRYPSICVTAEEHIATK